MRRYYLKNRKTQSKSHPKKRKAKLIIALIIFFLSLFLLFLLSKSKITKDRIIIASPNNSEGEIIIIDPSTKTINIIQIPKDTQTQAARQKGTWRMGSLWKLGEQEKYNGSFFSDSLILTFQLPIDYWAEEGFSKLANNPLSLTGFIFDRTKSNINFIDRIKLSLIIFSIPKNNVTTINLKDTDLLKSTKLIDGENGYVVLDKIPQLLTRLFFSQFISEENLKINIINSSNSSRPMTLIASVVQILGAKVNSFQNSPETTSAGCLVRSLGQSQTLNSILQIFSCKHEAKKPEGNFDLEINLGNF